MSKEVCFVLFCFLFFSFLFFSFETPESPPLTSIGSKRKPMVKEMFFFDIYIIILFYFILFYFIYLFISILFYYYYCYYFFMRTFLLQSLHLHQSEEKENPGMIKGSIYFFQ